MDNEEEIKQIPRLPEEDELKEELEKEEEEIQDSDEELPPLDSSVEIKRGVEQPYQKSKFIHMRKNIKVDSLQRQNFRYDMIGALSSHYSQKYEYFLKQIDELRNFKGVDTLKEDLKDDYEKVMKDLLEYRKYYNYLLDLEALYFKYAKELNVEGLKLVENRLMLYAKKLQPIRPSILKVFVLLVSNTELKGFAVPSEEILQAYMYKQKKKFRIQEEKEHAYENI